MDRDVEDPALVSVLGPVLSESEDEDVLARLGPGVCGMSTESSSSWGSMGMLFGSCF